MYVHVRIIRTCVNNSRIASRALPQDIFIIAGAFPSGCLFQYFNEHRQAPFPFVDNAKLDIKTKQ